MSEQEEKTQTESKIDTMLHRRNFLVALHTKAIGNKRKDTSASDEIYKKFHSDAKMGQFVKHLFNPKSLSRINSLRVNATQTMQKVGIPWNNGWYAVNVNRFEELRGLFRDMSKEWDIAVNAWLDNYEEHIEQAKEKLGKMFNEEQYPSKEEVAKMFEFRLEMNPITHASDVSRLILDEKDVEKLKEFENNIETRQAELVNKGMQFVYGQIINALERIINRIEESSRFNSNNTMLASIRKIVENLPLYNIAEDERMTELHKEMKDSPLMTLTIDDLKEDETKQQEAKDEAKRFLDKVRSLM